MQVSVQRAKCRVACRIRRFRCRVKAVATLGQIRQYHLVAHSTVSSGAVVNPFAFSADSWEMCTYFRKA